MTDRDKTQIPLGDKKEPAMGNKEEFDSPKRNQKRKSIDKTPVKRKRVQSESAEQLSSQSPEPCCSAATVENVLEDMEEEIDNALEQPCYKNKLTPTNVKSILRHIIANEYVLTMVRSTMNPSEGRELGEIAFEPKLTRSKAKEMRKQQCSLPWPVASPAKTVQNKKLLEEEFPDESSGDEDYKPEEECHSEDDDAAASSKASDAGTPRSRRQSLPSSPVSKTTDLMSEDENALVIALPELEIPLDASEADKIALRTRSKLCLNNTPLEEIEASFIAPDFTMDMYDTRCDDEDWHSFLCELVKPIDSTATHDHPDDAENDPEYKAIEDEVPDYEDLRYEQITTDEWNDLMLGTYELAQEDLSFLDDENEEDAGFTENVVAPSEIALGSMCVKNVISIWMTFDERLQLDEQLRMYVQLLAQSHLLSHANPALENLNKSTKIFLEEMKMFATRERASPEPSAFYAQNLDGALDIVKKFESINLPFDVINTKQTKKHLPLVPPHIKQTLASNQVFVYPELLPTCGFRSLIEIGKHFNTPEDNLITLGLEQFEGLKDPIECIHKYLIPIKSIERIRSRIKNCKLKKYGMNSIKFYHEHKQAPKFQRVIRIFDPDNIKAPEEYPPEFLPKWMESFSKLSNTDSVNPGVVPALGKKPSPTATVTLPPFLKALKPRKYVPILPRGLYFSPLQHVNPILKKYAQLRPRPPSICDSESPYKPPPLKPKIKLSHLNPELNSTRSNSKKTTECDANIQKKVVVEAAKNTQNKIVSSSVENMVFAKRQKKRLAARQGVWASLSGCESFAVRKSSEEKTVVTKISEEVDNGICDLGQELVASAATKLCDEVDDGICVDGQESAVTTFKAVSTRGRKDCVKKKHNRHHRDLESSLALLQPPVVKDVFMKEEREVMFANSYLLRATEILKGDSEVYEKFLSTLCKYHLSTRSPVELYSELKDILKDYPVLVRDFIVFLRPEQAKECGRYKEHIALSKVRGFFRKIEIHFKDHPEHISQILRTFAQLQEQVDLTSAEVISAFQPLLVNQPNLFKELNDLLSSPK